MEGYQMECKAVRTEQRPRADTSFNNSFITLHNNWKERQKLNPVQYLKKMLARQQSFLIG